MEHANDSRPHLRSDEPDPTGWVLSNRAPLAKPFSGRNRGTLLASLTALLALTGGVFHSAAQAEDQPASAASIQGFWQGSYSCGPNPAGLDVHLKAIDGGGLQGRIDFYPIASTRVKFKAAAYSVKGQIQPDGSLVLQPVEWIEKQPGYFMGTLNGKLSGTGSYTGVVVECKGDQAFTISKISDETEKAASGTTVASAGSDPSSAGAASESNAVGSFFSKIGNGVLKGLKESGDPVIVRGFVRVDEQNMAKNPLCLYDLKTKELTGNAVFGVETRHKDGSPGFKTTAVTAFDCQKLEENGRLMVTNYTGMSPETTPFRATKGSPSLGHTPLVGIFTKNPFDGTPQTYYPRVAVTVTNWTSGVCWEAQATIWRSATSSTQVPTFNVCWRSQGAMNAANALMEGDALHKQLEAQQPEASTGNVRTTGPKAPLHALPERVPTSLARGPYLDFLRALTYGTGWISGAPTNLWLTTFGPTQ